MEGIKCVLLDIEGTICPISFVKETLFPYALKALPDVLASKWDSKEFKPYRDAFPQDARGSLTALQAHVEDLTQRDVKVAYLKNLQGYLWETGYKTGAYSTPLFVDVLPKLKEWNDAGIKLAIYSSGSVFAQKLLFEHVQSAAGQKKTREESENTLSKAAAGGQANLDDAHAQPEDLQYLISNWFDTTNAGPKTGYSSYKTIRDELENTAQEVLFLSDNVNECDAAIAAGMRSLIVDRPGNAPLPDWDSDKLSIVKSLEDVHIKYQE